MDPTRTVLEAALRAAGVLKTCERRAQTSVRSNTLMSISSPPLPDAVPTTSSAVLSSMSRPISSCVPGDPRRTRARWLAGRQSAWVMASLIQASPSIAARSGVRSASYSPDGRMTARAAGAPCASTPASPGADRMRLGIRAQRSARARMRVSLARSGGRPLRHPTGIPTLRSPHYWLSGSSPWRNGRTTSTSARNRSALESCSGEDSLCCGGAVPVAARPLRNTV